MDIQFLGAAKIVTGSNYLIKMDKYNIIVDCGMFQGNNEKEEMNYKDFQFNPAEIDYMILTHAHIDHSGRIPKLVKDGFRGKIFCTKSTYDLCKIMLIDSAKIQESDVKWENKKRQRAGQKLAEPLYTIKDAEDSLKYFEPYYYGQNIIINEDITLKFRDAGHILGSSIIELWLTEDGKTNKIVFSGDLGMPGRPIIKDPEFIQEADYLILESTYGDTNHESFSYSTEKLIEIINNTVAKNGTVLIPSFAVGRTQELIYELNNYYAYDKTIEEHMRIPIYIDSPMAINATEAFEANSNSFNDEAKALILSGDNPFNFPNLRYIRSQEESMALNKSNYPKVIISASGMATAGRIRHHLKHNLWNPNNSLVFVGYQAEGTLGRILLDGVKKVKLLGEEIEVNLEIFDLEGFSAHADQKTLLKFIDSFERKPKKIFLVHGEEGPANVLSDLIKEKYNLDVIIPNLGDEFTIQKHGIELRKGIKLEPAMLKADIENEFKNVYNQFEALIMKTDELYEEKKMEKDYDLLKNKLIDLQNNLMDLNMMLGK